MALEQTKFTISEDDLMSSDNGDLSDSSYRAPSVPCATLNEPSPDFVTSLDNADDFITPTHFESSCSPSVSPGLREALSISPIVEVFDPQSLAVLCDEVAAACERLAGLL